MSIQNDDERCAPILRRKSKDTKTTDKVTALRRESGATSRIELLAAHFRVIHLHKMHFEFNYNKKNKTKVLVNLRTIQWSFETIRKTSDIKLHFLLEIISGEVHST